MSEAYIIVSLSDAKVMLAALSGETTDDGRLAPIMGRLRQETGADIQDIATSLKKLPLCYACVVEDQQRNCNVLYAQKSGRRLQRLIARADA